jgi:hypothetical protein
MAARWRRIERPEHWPACLEDSDQCYYAREYISRGGYSASEANQLISNFKKAPDKKQTAQWEWKERAILQFARELRLLLNDGSTVAAIPTSKREDDPQYDSRLDDVLKTLRQFLPALVIERPFEVTESHQSAHTGGGRGPEEFYQLLKWKGLRFVPPQIVLIDDVITSGSHFKACQRLINEHHPAIEIAGVFWAKVIWPEVDLEIGLL